MYDNEPGEPGIWKEKKTFEDRDEVPHVLKTVHGMPNFGNQITQR
jgi:hypothetical protein